MKEKFVLLQVLALLLLIADISIPVSEVSAEDKTSLPLTIVPLINNKTVTTCPSKQERFVLVAQHTWDFSPGGATNVMEITGSTNTDSCTIWVSGDAAIAEDCVITYTNTGKVYTSAGTCTQKGASSAILSFDKGKCRRGTIIITITETQNPNAGPGRLPDMSGHFRTLPDLLSAIHQGGLFCPESKRIHRY